MRLAAGRVPVPAEDRDAARGQRAGSAARGDGRRAPRRLPGGCRRVRARGRAGRRGRRDRDRTVGPPRRRRRDAARAHPGAARAASPPTWCASARSGPGPRPGCAGGSPSPGVDEWHGTFPSEDAAAAWAAIDRLAHDLVAAGTCSNVEQARGKALTDLVTGNATVDVQVVLTVPADTGSPRPAAAARSAAATRHRRPSRTSAHAAGQPDSPVRAHDVAGASPTTQAARHAPVAISPSQITRTTSTHAPLPPTRRPTPRRPTLRQRGDDDDLVEVQGARPSEPLLVRRGWLRDHLAEGATQSPARRAAGSTAVRAVRPAHRSATRPGRRTSRPTPTDPAPSSQHWSAPGTVAAASPAARSPPGSATSTTCGPGRSAAPRRATCSSLCRRHHRIKQRPGWRLRLAPDGTATWTDPTGRVRTTAPLNALRSLVLVSEPTDDECHADTRRVTPVPATRSLASPASTRLAGNAPLSSRTLPSFRSGVRSRRTSPSASSTTRTTVRGTTSGPTPPTGAAPQLPTCGRRSPAAEPAPSSLTCRPSDSRPGSHVAGNHPGVRTSSAAPSASSTASATDLSGRRPPA